MSLPCSTSPMMVAATAAAYQVSRSLRFNSADSASLSRTYTTGATWTLSAWLKLSSFAAVRNVLNGIVYFNSSDQLIVPGITSSNVFRDGTAWLHLVVSNAGLFINGSALSGTVLTVPLVNVSIGTAFNGYIANVQLIDGSSLSASNFGSVNGNGQWQPLSYSGTHGSQGFRLTFADNSAATAATLGADTSGNGNNWTPNNLSVTAGAGNDSLVDSPTSYGTDTGLGGSVRGNYCTFNPLRQGGASSPNGTHQNGNLELAGINTSFWYNAFGTIFASSGKWYAELTPISGTTNSILIGVVNGTAPVTYFPGSDSFSYGYYSSNGNKLNNTGGGTGVGYGPSYTTNDVIGIALDLNAGTLTFYKNGTSLGVAFSGLPAGSWTFAIGTANSSLTAANFGQRPFTYAAPSGFKALCTQNLSAGSVTTSGSFTGNALVDGPLICLNGIPTAMTINGNAVTIGTHADKLAGGFKVRSSSASYNSSGSNTYSITTNGGVFKHANAQKNP